MTSAVPPFIDARSLPAAASAGRSRQIGLAYSLWHDNPDWNKSADRCWGTPLIGPYRSDNPQVLARHAERLAEASVDFVYVDWSNDLNFDIRTDLDPPAQHFIETATLKLFQVWSKLSRRPRIAIMIGDPLEPEAVRNGHLQRKADEVHALFVADPAFLPMLQMHEGKPLLIVYVNSPSPYQDGLPSWSDNRFTVRWMTAFINEQPKLKGPPGGSRYNFWSWEEIGTPTYSMSHGRPECMTVVAAWRGPDTPGRCDGRIFLEGWHYARRIAPQIVLAGTFNEWKTSEQPSARVSKDLEDSRESGTFYLDLLSEQAALFKAEEPRSHARAGARID